jgi:hypothetical protein
MWTKGSFLQLSVCVVLFSVASAASANKPLSIVVQPLTESSTLIPGVTLTASVTNNSREKVWFSTCPEPYTIEMVAHGQLVPYRHPTAGDSVCGATVIITIDPGKTWTTKIALTSMFDRKAETYSVRVLWRFPWNVRKTAQGSDWDTLIVSSNEITFAVGP